MAAVAAGAVGGDGVDGAALPLARDGEDGRHVGGESLLERGEREQRVAVLLRGRERLAVNEVRLDVGAREFRGARHQGLDGVCDVVRLVEHVGRVEALDTCQLRVHQLVEDEEELEGLDRAGVEVVVAVLRVVEVEAGELAELDEARDDHLDVDVRRVVAEVHEAERLRPQLARAVIAHAPVVDDRRVEGRLVELVLDEEPPVRRQSRVDVAHALKVQLERATKVLLTGEVPAVADPDRVRLRADLPPQLDALDVVLDGLPAHVRFGVREAAVLVRVRLARLILERVGVHRVEVQAARARELDERVRVFGPVPGDVERDAGGRADELVDGRAVFELLEDAARLAHAGEAREARPARPHAPRRHRHAERLRLRRQLLDVAPAAAQLFAEVLEVLLDPGPGRLVLLGDEVVVNLEVGRHVSSVSRQMAVGSKGFIVRLPPNLLRRCLLVLTAYCHLPTAYYLRKPSCKPPSTGMTWPVVFASLRETSRKMPSA